MATSSYALGSISIGINQTNGAEMLTIFAKGGPDTIVARFERDGAAIDGECKGRVRTELQLCDDPVITDPERQENFEMVETFLSKDAPVMDGDPIFVE